MLCEVQKQNVLKNGTYKVYRSQSLYHHPNTLFLQNCFQEVVSDHFFYIIFLRKSWLVLVLCFVSLQYTIYIYSNISWRASCTSSFEIEYNRFIRNVVLIYYIRFYIFLHDDDLKIKKCPPCNWNNY